MRKWIYASGSLLVVGLAALVVSVALPAKVSQAHPTNAFLQAAESQYPWIVGTQLDQCVLCHVSNTDFDRNPYGADWASHGNSFTAIENLDSDHDGFTNIVEIKALTFPGNPDSKPSGTPNAPLTPTMTPTATPTFTPTNTPAAAPTLTLTGTVTSTPPYGLYFPQLVN